MLAIHSLTALLVGGGAAWGSLACVDGVRSLRFAVFDVPISVTLRGSLTKILRLGAIRQILRLAGINWGHVRKPDQ